MSKSRRENARLYADIVGADNLVNNKEQYTSYSILVHGFFGDWIVLRRYSEFRTLKRKVYKEVSGLKLPSFPSKTLFRQTDHVFVRRRQEELNRWLQAVLEHADLRYCEAVFLFLRTTSDIAASVLSTSFGCAQLLIPVLRGLFEHTMMKMQNTFRSDSSTDGATKEILFHAFETRWTRLLTGLEEVSRNFQVSTDAPLAADLTCPISHDMMVYPVVAQDGYTYERECIEQWLNHSNVSPLTGLQITDKTLYPNYNIRSWSRVIQTWEEQRQVTQRDFLRQIIEAANCEPFESVSLS
eukprot:GILJ01011126.1.p1 GENE.GILJ01011126.1~~GILJ01011126.1.p1  ORF type:complete len:297 (-),score=23.25 GILJ01011126.1:281-1171(-)